MPKSAQKKQSYRIQQHNKITVTDLIEGTAQLTASGVLEVTELVEAVHKDIILLPFKFLLKNSKKYTYVESVYQKTTGRIYSVVKSIATFSGSGTAKTLRNINAKLPNRLQNKKLSKSSQLIVSSVNGLMGDYLSHTKNPIAMPMHLYNSQGITHHLQNLDEHVVILVHGLCMSYLGWHPENSKSLGRRIKKTFKKSNVLYLNYNTGKRISQNGESFSNLLTKIVENNPRIKRIDIIGHSMGGLLTRSAMYHASKNGDPWVPKVDKFIALCSPHHGAVLERISFFAQEYLSTIPIAGNFSRLGDLRSAGIIDVRYGNVRHEDWVTTDKKMVKFNGSRASTPLPKNVTTYLVAATLDATAKYDVKELSGDGLVSVSSALGECDVDCYYGYYNIQVPQNQKFIFYNMNHMKIIHDEVVHKRIIKWLSKDNKLS